jgi:hypothetical protein
MRFDVEFTPGAGLDLFKIHRYIKADGRPETAKRLLEKHPPRLVTACHMPLSAAMSHLSLKVSAKCYAVKLSLKIIELSIRSSEK